MALSISNPEISVQNCTPQRNPINPRTFPRGRDPPARTKSGTDAEISPFDWFSKRAISRAEKSQFGSLALHHDAAIQGLRRAHIMGIEPGESGDFVRRDSHWRFQDEPFHAFGAGRSGD